MKAFCAALCLLGLTIAPAYAEGDAAKGLKVFNKCKACHSAEEASNKTGPHLVAVVGRKIASVKDYGYSRDLAALGDQGAVWDEATLDKYLTNPKDVAPKGKMAFPGLKKPEERADLIAYLKTK